MACCCVEAADVVKRPPLVTIRRFNASTGVEVWNNGRGFQARIAAGGTSVIPAGFRLGDEGGDLIEFGTPTTDGTYSNVVRWSDGATAATLLLRSQSDLAGGEYRIEQALPAIHLGLYWTAGRLLTDAGTVYAVQAYDPVTLASEFLVPLTGSIPLGAGLDPLQPSPHGVLLHQRDGGSGHSGRVVRVDGDGTIGAESIYHYGYTLSGSNVTFASTWGVATFAMVMGVSIAADGKVRFLSAPVDLTAAADRWIELTTTDADLQVATSVDLAPHDFGPYTIAPAIQRTTAYATNQPCYQWTRDSFAEATSLTPFINVQNLNTLPMPGVTAGASVLYSVSGDGIPVVGTWPYGNEVWNRYEWDATGGSVGFAVGEFRTCSPDQTVFVVAGGGAMNGSYVNGSISLVKRTHGVAVSAADWFTTTKMTAIGSLNVDWFPLRTITAWATDGTDYYLIGRPWITQDGSSTSNQQALVKVAGSDGAVLWTARHLGESSAGLNGDEGDPLLDVIYRDGSVYVCGGGSTYKP